MKLAKDLMPQIDTVLTRQRVSFPEIEGEVFWNFYDACKDYSLLHVTGFYNVFQSFSYIARNHLRGNAVECGCFLGGMAMFMGLCRKHFGIEDMEILLFDTFEGPPLGSTDTIFGHKIETPTLLPNYREAVPQNIASVIGNTEGYQFIEGLVEDTLRKAETGLISLLRLDTDFYSSTYIELEVLYPRLVSGGVLIVDDYGLFQGSRRATDEYFGRISRPPLLNRIDMGVWSGVKP